MNWHQFRMAFRTLPFLDSHANSPTGVLTLHARPTPKLLVWHPEAIDWIFRSDQRLRHPGSGSLTPLFGHRSLLWVDGPRHGAYRRVLGPPLRGRRLTEYRGLISEAVHTAIDALVPGTVIGLSRWTRQLTLRIMARILLGQPDDALLTSFADWMEKALGARYRTHAYRYLTGRLPRSGEKLDQMLVRCARTGTLTRPPALASLLLTDDGPLGTIDDAELRDALVSLLFAGHETTASATAWTLYWLDREATIRHDVLAELDATAADGSDAAQVPLLHAVIQEVLRLTPPAIVAGNRVLREEGKLLGQVLTAGTTLTPSIYLVHRQSDYFPMPHHFDPNRFIGRRISREHYFPFGGGTRYCLGSQLAYLEIRMITTALLRRREWHCINPHAGVFHLRGHVLAPASWLRMKVTKCRE